VRVRLVAPLVTAISLALLAPVEPAVASATAILVLGGSGIDQLEPMANASYFSWIQNSTAHPKHHDAFVRPIPPGGQEPVKVNPAGTQGFIGGIDGDTTTAIYQQVAKGRSNLFMYDLSTGVRSQPPSNINTKLWEWAPTISSGYIEFGRLNNTRPRSASWVLLYDRTTGDIKELASEPRGCFCITPYQVSDQFATWVVCLKLCRVWYYNIKAGTTHEVPDPQGLDQYDPSVDGATKTIYFVQAHGPYCGVHVKIMRWVAGSPISSAATVTSIPSGYDVAATTYVYVDSGGHDQLFFDRLQCSGKYYADLYEVPNADTA
jgi:hypothetical protein